MGSFMQMGSEMERRVERIVSQSSQVDDFQRQSVMDLLQGKQTAQSSGEITGMLKAMLEEMEVRRSEPREAIGLDNSDVTLLSGERLRVRRLPGSFQRCSDAKRPGCSCFCMMLVGPVKHRPQGDLKSATADEATAAKGFSDLSAAKNAEIASATSAIESKTKRAGEVAVEIVR